MPIARLGSLVIRRTGCCRGEPMALKDKPAVFLPVAVAIVFTDTRAHRPSAVKRGHDARIEHTVGSVSAIIRPARRPGAAPRSRGARPAVATRRAVLALAGHQQPVCYSPRPAALSRARRPRPRCPAPRRCASAALSPPPGRGGSCRAARPARWGPGRARSGMRILT